MSLSIIIPTLNEEANLKILLDIILVQKLENYEIIVVDAKSTDKTCEIVEKYSKKINIYLLYSKNRNVAHQRNLGAINAKYSTILFLDADVNFDENFISRCLAEMRRRKCRIAIPKYIPVDRRWYYKSFFFLVNSLFRLLSKVKPTGIGACIFSTKEAHLKICGFNEGLRWTDDMDYVSKVSEISRFGILRTKVYVSMRRFEKEGTKKTMWKWTRAYFLHLIDQPEVANKIKYF